MNVLLDTHAYLWYIAGSEELSGPAREAIDSAEKVFLSTASLWEITIKFSLKRLSLAMPLEELFSRFVENIGFDKLSIEPRHMIELSSLSFVHRDPFDRMLIAQAKADELSFVTKDRMIRQYPINVIW